MRPGPAQTRRVFIPLFTQPTALPSPLDPTDRQPAQGAYAQTTYLDCILCMTVLFEHLLLYSLQTHSRKSSELYLPSHTLGVSLFTGLRPLYATGNTKNIQGETPSTTLTTHLDLLCTPSTMLSFFLPSLPLLNTSFYTQPQGLRATSFLQHLCSIHTPPYATSS